MEDHLKRVIFSLAFLLLLPACRAEYKVPVHVVGQSKPVVATVGDDVILPCTVRNTISPINVVDEAVEWQRPDLHPKEVHFLRNRVDYNDDQNNNYRGRTSLFKEELRNGNVSLKLTRVKLSDAGNYTCFIPTRSTDHKASVQLIVAAVSPLEISLVGIDHMGVILKCESRGWYPEPEMTWLDSDGTILPADGPTETETDSEGRYTVRGLVTVQKTDNNTITCRVLQQKINHKMETQIHVPDQLFPELCQSSGRSCWSGWWFGVLIGVLIVLVVGSVVLYILRRKGLLPWGRGDLNRDPQTNGTSQRKGMPNGNAQSDPLLPVDSGV